MKQDRRDLNADPSLGRVRRRLASWLGLLLLAFNVLAAAALPARAESALAQSLMDGRIVVCTAAGLLVLDQDGRALPASDHAQFCVFCLPLLHGGVDVPATPVLADRPTFAPAALLPAGENRPWHPAAHGRVRSRAPPSLS